MRSGIPIKGASLAGVELFADLDLDAREEIAGHCSGSGFQAGETVLGHKDSSRDIYFVLSGTVEISVFSVGGKRVTFNEKGPGTMLGELSAIDGQPRSAHAIAKTDCRTASLSPADFQKVVATNPAVANFMLRNLVAQIRKLSDRVFEFNALCVNNRIHVELLRLARSGAEEGLRREVRPAPTHAEIASRVSSHREAVSREMSKLAKQGLLEKGRDSLIVTDVEKLAELVEQSLGESPVSC